VYRLSSYVSETGSYSEHYESQAELGPSGLLLLTYAAPHIPYRKWSRSPIIAWPVEGRRDGKVQLQN